MSWVDTCGMPSFKPLTCGASLIDWLHQWVYLLRVMMCYPTHSLSRYILDHSRKHLFLGFSALLIYISDSLLVGIDEKKIKSLISCARVLALPFPFLFMVSKHGFLMR